jgi:AraC-like DNA-binding protein
MKLIIHAIPAVIIMMYILILIIQREFFLEKISELGKALYFFYKFQLLAYSFYTVLILNKYQHQIINLTSTSEKRKLNWLFFITYGIAINAMISFILNLFTQFTTMYLGYIFFLIFINIFFFKAIIQPDQFLGIDETKMLPLKLERDKSVYYFRNIEEMINTKQLYLDPDLNLHNVAQAVKLPDRIVSQAIKQNTELSFIDYINKKRINYAKDALRSTTKSEKNILEILFEAGFNSKSVFNMQFKKHTGQSPTDFRQSNSIM